MNTYFEYFRKGYFFDFLSVIIPFFIFSEGIYIYNFIPNSIEYSYELNLYFICCILSLIFFLKIVFNHQTNYKLLIIDIAILLLSAYKIIINLYYGNHDFISSCLTLVYFYFRTFIGQNHVTINKSIYVLIVVHLIQITICYKQIYNLFASSLRQPIYGTFVNSGPLAIYLASVIPLALFYFLNKVNTKNKFIEQIFLWYLIFVVPIIAISLSRSAIVGIIAGIFVGLYSFYKSKLFSWFNKRGIISRALILFFFPFFFVLGAIFFYKIKQNSSDGRILIWKVSFNLIKENFLFGHGANSFLGLYHKYQGEYFANNPNDTLSIYLADQVFYVFNSYLNLIIEYGLLGLILFLVSMSLVIFYAFYRKQNNWQMSGAIGGIIIILTSSITSYPLEIIPININLFFFIFLIVFNSNKRVIYYSITHKKKYYIFSFCTFALCIILFIFSYNRFENLKKWHSANQLTETNSIKAKHKYDSIYLYFKDNPRFLIDIANNYSKNNLFMKSIGFYRESSVYLTDTIIYGGIARNFVKLSMFDSSEYYFKKQINVIPGRFFPRYNLQKLYILKNDTLSAKKNALTIIRLKEKVKNPIVDTIKSKMRVYLKSKKNTHE